MSTQSTLGAASSFLFVPGDRPDRFDRAEQTGADIVIIDLEDAVGVPSKDGARASTVAWLRTGRHACVRINGIDSPHHDDDVTMLQGLETFSGVVVPKAESAELCNTLASRLQVPVIALIESAKGLAAAREIASAAGVARLALGHLDLALDLGCSTAQVPMLAARSLLVLESRFAGLPAPVDGVTTDLAEDEQLRDDLEHAVDMGFGGKLLIHPRQVAATVAAWHATPQQRDWAQKVLSAAHDEGAVKVNNEMVDPPVIAPARRILEGSNSHD